MKLDVDDRETLHMIARTSVRTKLSGAFADQLAAIVLDAVLTVRVVDEKIDLHMVEIMHMKHKVRSVGNRPFEPRAITPFSIRMTSDRQGFGSSQRYSP